LLKLLPPLLLCLVLRLLARSRGGRQRPQLLLHAYHLLLQRRQRLLGLVLLLLRSQGNTSVGPIASQSSLQSLDACLQCLKLPTAGRACSLAAGSALLPALFCLPLQVLLLLSSSSSF
jgi:hypothetical protein